jgi:HK97 gp10 family phage protein
MSLKIRLESETVSAKLAGVHERIVEEVGKEIDVVGADIEDMAKTLVPVRTGYLKSTIYHRVEGMNLEVGAEADYAVYVECGTSRMRAQPYLRPAVDANQEKLRDAVKVGVLNALEKG